MQSSKSTIEKPTFSRVINGDIREAKSGFITNGCNAANSHGSGLAGSIYKKWPQVKQDYHNTYQKQGNVLYLGNYTFIPVKEDLSLYVVNMITQENFGYDGSLYLSYAALEVCFHNMFKQILRDPALRVVDRVVHVPKIGCGLAGGEWDKVERILSKVKVPEIELVHWEYN